MKAIVHFDGGCRPTNPGHAGIGVVAYMNENDGRGAKGHEFSRYIGIKTNNQAEYMACVMAIKFAKHLGASEIKMFTDSQLVMNQILGVWKVRDTNLRPYRKLVLDSLSRTFPDAWEICWWERENNQVADALATEAINWGRNFNPFTPEKIKAKRPGRIVDFLNEDDKPPITPNFFYLLTTK